MHIKLKVSSTNLVSSSPLKPRIWFSSSPLSYAAAIDHAYAVVLCCCVSSILQNGSGILNKLTWYATGRRTFNPSILISFVRLSLYLCCPPYIGMVYVWCCGVLNWLAHFWYDGLWYIRDACTRNLQVSDIKIGYHVAMWSKAWELAKFATCIGNAYYSLSYAYLIGPVMEISLML